MILTAAAFIGGIFFGGVVCLAVGYNQGYNQGFLHGVARCKRVTEELIKSRFKPKTSQPAAPRLN